MSWNLTSSFQVNATLVANEFIDRFMAEANGEYVKVYLYLLRHQPEAVTVEQIADALNHTENDVNRALSYWRKAGVIREEEKLREAAEESAAAAETVREARAATEQGISAESYSGEQMSRLVKDEEFSQLIYVAQKYMNKIFTQRDCQVFAYLYDGLKMSSELLEYLVEYCVQGGHASIRYVETVALNWHEKGFKTVEQARAYAAGFTKECFGVMRAFGLSDRQPGQMEKQMIERWFKVMGFTSELVLEACNRTMEATHAPSFKYADKILTEWKKAGVRTMEDVRLLDEKHQNRSRRERSAGKPAAAKKSSNQFHNFEQRNTDYDALVLEQLREQLK